MLFINHCRSEAIDPVLRFFPSIFTRIDDLRNIVPPVTLTNSIIHYNWPPERIQP